jgi:hypothetical protein
MPCFLAALRGSASDCPLYSGNETTKKRAKNPVLSKIGRLPIDAVQADGTRGRDFEPASRLKPGLRTAAPELRCACSRPTQLETRPAEAGTTSTLII